jgi:hypothetical protein
MGLTILGSDSDIPDTESCNRGARVDVTVQASGPDEKSDPDQVECISARVLKIA